jgi:hypothetical protein
MPIVICRVASVVPIAEDVTLRWLQPWVTLGLEPSRLLPVYDGVIISLKLGPLT